VWLRPGACLIRKSVNYGRKKFYSTDPWPWKHSARPLEWSTADVFTLVGSILAPKYCPGVELTDIDNVPVFHNLELITSVKSFIAQTPFHPCKENFSINAKRQHFCHFICQLKIKHSIEQPKTFFSPFYLS
jgi:hypothetical protein